MVLQRVMVVCDAGGGPAPALQQQGWAGRAARGAGNGLQPEDEQGAASRHPCAGLVHCPC